MRFAIDPAGRRVCADWDDHSEVKSVNDAAGLLLGPVLGGLLRLRGTISLHACVIDIGSRAVVLMGERGAGKSTLAVAAAQRGHAVLSDDIAAIAESPGGDWSAQPGYPRLRLGPRTIDALAGSSPEAGPVWTGMDKRYLELSTGNGTAAGRFQPEPLRVGALYELRRDPELAAPLIEPIAGADRVATLLRHTRQALAPLDPGSRDAEFSRLGRLAASVPMSRLTCPDDLASLSAVCRAIAEDAT
ncbi:MAG: serine/threonine protein kinase [Thermoleophilaceae bacterium]